MMADKIRLLIALCLLSGCPGIPAPRSTATVRAGDLPGDVEGLKKYADEQFMKQEAIAIENSLVALDKAIGLDGRSEEILWRAARATAWLADEYRDKSHRAGFARRGIEYAKRAIDVTDTRVEGHYYYGINLGLYATTKTIGAHGDVPVVAKEAEKAMKIDEKYEHAGPLRLLGSVYAKAPPWPVSIGDTDEGVKYLKRAVELSPEDPQNHLLYGDALAADKRPKEATREYQIVLAAQPMPEWAHRLERWKQEADAAIKKLEHKPIDSGAGATTPF